MTLTCASFFTGVGGIDLAFTSTNKFEVVYANENDPYPAKTFEANFPIQVDLADIRKVNPINLQDFDVLLAGFPCQAFSIAGAREGFCDKLGRGTLFFELTRIIKVKRPKIIFLENVKHLLNHNHGNTFKAMLEALESLGYSVKYEVLNAMTHGNIPQNRERIYIVGFQDKSSYERFSFPGKIPLTTKVNDIIDKDSLVSERYYYTPGKYKAGMYEKLYNSVTDFDAVYQWRRQYVRKNAKGVIPTLTANQGTGGHNVCIVKTKHGIRRMTPRECFMAQGFPQDFKLPKDTSNTRLYKQAGNSVCVSVIKRIAEEIAIATELH